MFPQAEVRGLKQNLPFLVRQGAHRIIKIRRDSAFIHLKRNARYQSGKRINNNTGTRLIYFSREQYEGRQEKPLLLRKCWKLAGP